MLLAIILLLLIASFALLYFALAPILFKRYESLQEERARGAAQTLENMFVWVTHKKLIFLFALSPVVMGFLFFFLFKNSLLIFVGVVVGFVLPMFVIRYLERLRKRKFQGQLVDALNSLSQSLKAGLSFLQAMEAVIEEMPPPISQEFSTVIKENKMGVPFEESLEKLNKRMAIEELNMMTTAILVARETGGNLTDIFTNLSDTIRAKNRISEQVKTLTTQARLQGIIMSLLPIGFGIMIFKINPEFFDIMYQSDIGRMLLVWCVVSEIIGAVMLNQLSRVEV